MTNTDFNEKYKHLLDYVEQHDGSKLYHSGLCFTDPDVMEFLDEIFTNVCSKIEGFKFRQIKVKFGKCCFYSSVEGFQFEMMVEQKIDELLSKKLIE